MSSMAKGRRRVPRVDRLLGSEQCIRVELALALGGCVLHTRRLSTSTTGTLTLSSSVALGLQLHIACKRGSVLRVDARALVRLRLVDAHPLRDVARALTAPCIMSLLHGHGHINDDLGATAGRRSGSALRQRRREARRSRLKVIRRSDGGARAPARQHTHAKRCDPRGTHAMLR